MSRTSFALSVVILAAFAPLAVAQDWGSAPGPSGTTSLFYFGGNVGIGTGSPVWPLQITPNTSYTGTGGLIYGPNDFTTVLIAGTHAPTSGIGIGALYLCSVLSGTQAAYATHVVFDVTGAGNVTRQAGIMVRPLAKGTAGNTHMLVGQDIIPDGNYGIYSGTTYPTFFNGNVGVGTAAPTAKLHVVGNVNIQGTLTGTNIQATYQDLAEWVESDQPLEAGTVVVLSTEKTDTVLPSSHAYDTSVAGVVSAQPGIILGVPGESKSKIATTGRVKVLADATRGAIKIGDLLVTSNERGYAMRSEPIDIAGAKMHRPGTIVGKALEPLANGKGDILVLLSLQ